MSEEEGFECPKCGELARFERRGKRRFLTCLNCGERIGLSEVPNEYIDTTEVEREEPPKKEDTGPFTMSSEGEILADLMDDFDIPNKQRKVILGRLQKYGVLPPEDLLNLLVALGQKREVATLITQDYSNLISQQRQRQEAIMRASGQLREREQGPPPQQPDPIRGAIEILRAMRDMEPTKKSESTEVDELKKEIERLREDSRRNELQQLKESMNQQMQMLNVRLEESQGYKDDAYRMATALGGQYLQGVKEGKIPAFGTGIRAKGFTDTMHNFKSGKYKSREPTDSTEEIADLIDDEYIEEIPDRGPRIKEEYNEIHDEDPYSDIPVDGGDSE